MVFDTTAATTPVRFNKEQTLNPITDNMTIRQTRTGSEFNEQTLILNSRQWSMTQLR